MHDDIERILTHEDTIAPSASFAVSVMEAVEREAAAPRPLAFPWLRALPGFAATIAALVVTVWHGIASLRDPAAVALIDEQLRRLAALAAALGLQWILLAAAITVVSVMLSSSLVRGRGDV